MKQPGYKAYEKLLHSRLQVLGAETPLYLKLIEVKDMGVTDGYERFSLLFEGPSDRLLEQQTVVLEHESLEEFAVFIVPVRLTGSGCRYEAVFSLSVSDTRGG
ncbi:hypothetical protein DNH61_17540 [Paenibacillus sambharensis]|uniref:DUF6916 domain-containing protein n=1 Tax=Paenibacillus sambharensis TaxID=1803190 RepID=A0A2W1LRR6_9BACL|nr:hypothetical protein [Paenibacillus sambharensis]PZD94521.1 hypothetical protein DNH61_17540 [Paenibacillus sambharensis]